MKVKLVGYKELDFKSKEGDQVKGTSIYVEYKDDDVVGLMADKKFIKNSEVIEIDLKQFIGKDIDIELGLKGKVCCISAV